MAVSEKIELLGKNIYTDIPAQLTLKSFPTVTELEYVGSEDFEETMLNEIFPKAIEEQVNFNNLLEIDFQWICRGFRFLNYGPYWTTRGFVCNNCGPVQIEAQVDLRTVGCKPLPETFSNDIVISKDELIDYDKDIHIKLMTIKEVLNSRKDPAFKRANGSINTQLARICYSISQLGNDKSVNALTAKLEIEKKFSPADFQILKSKVAELTDYGLRAGGKCKCPQCHGDSATFLALADDRFFRPTVGDLKAGRNDRNLRGMEIASGDQTEAV
jgi:hypothetical protein